MEILRSVLCKKKLQVYENHLHNILQNEKKFLLDPAYLEIITIKNFRREYGLRITIYSIEQMCEYNMLISKIAICN